MEQKPEHVMSFEETLNSLEQFELLREMLTEANVASSCVTIEEPHEGNMSMVIKDSYKNGEPQTYRAFLFRNKLWLYLYDGRMEESRDRMNMVRVEHGDSWEKIKAKLNEPDPMTHEELLEAFAAHPDIQESLRKHPEQVFWSKNKVCQHCGKRIVSLYYESPAWTWEELCGRAGILYICPYCKEDDHFECEIMN